MKQPPTGTFNKARVETFSDGVFARVHPLASLAIYLGIPIYFITPLSTQDI